MPEEPAGNPPQPDYPSTPMLTGRDQTDRDLAMRMLYDEQNRLRAEVDRLRQEQAQQQKEGEKKDGDEKEGGDKKGDDDKGDGEKDKDKEKKPPLKERARSWISQHPIASVLIVVGFIMLVIACILLWNYLDSYTNTDDAFIDGHTDPISARINGFVAAVYVENTYRVKKGQLLAQLDDRDNLVAKEQASANYAQAQASVRAQAPNVPITDINESTQVINSDFDIINAEASVAAAEERFRSAQADLSQAEVNKANADREEKRYKLLVDKEEVSREQYDQRATEARAQAQVVASRHEMAAAAEKSVKQAEAQLGTARQRNAQAKRNLPNQLAIQRETLQQRLANEKAAKAQADQSELNLEYTRIYAPEDGVIGDKEVQVGEQVAPGQELFALTQTNDIWVTANFKETQIARMHAGQSVTIHVDAISMDFDGYIEALPGASGAVYSLLPPENATGNYVKVVQRLPVRIRIKPGQNGAERLAPGMSVEPKVWLR
jgi:membrane fusion protein (multidrug efflux system)